MNYFNQFKMPEITPLSHYVTGQASFDALKKAVNEIVRLAPKDHDILIHAFNIFVTEIRYVEPHTFIFSGFDHEGNNTSVVCHYSQLLAKVVYLPKRNEERQIIGFKTN